MDERLTPSLGQNLAILGQRFATGPDAEVIGANLMENGQLKKIPTPAISAADYAAIQAHIKEKGLNSKFVNMGVVKPVADEAESRKLFEAAKRLGIDVLVAEPQTHATMKPLFKSPSPWAVCVWW